jgi:hypothetical protein
MYIAAKILLSYLASSTAPDLCDVVNTSTGSPTICIPHADGAPEYNGDVCCTGSSCVKPISGTCTTTSQKRFYCELGAVNAVGSVTCYFEVPDYCAVFPCELGIEAGSDPQEETICCEGDNPCTPYYGGGTCAPEYIYHCDSVQENPNGTVTCLDP